MPFAGAADLRPPSPAVAEPASPPAENLVRFDPSQVDVQWLDNRWQLVAGDKVLKDFGRREMEARQALRIVRELGLTQFGTIGSPRPVLEYWLVNGNAPQGMAPGLRTLSFDPTSLRVEQNQGQWWVRDAYRPLFTFGAHADEARQALDILRTHGFARVGYVGQGTPDMIVFLGGSAGLQRGAMSGPPSLSPRAVLHPQVTQANEQHPGAMPTPPPEANGLRQASALAPTPLPSGRQLASPATTAPDLAALGERVPFDWRQVQMRHDNRDWKLMAGSYTLADFGSDESEARRAYNAVQYYRFTEHWLVGRPQPAFSYFLAAGQAPRGLQFGLNSLPFRPDTLAVKQQGNAWVIGDGTQTVLSFGSRAEEARQVLQVIQRYKFDHLCRLGHGEAGGMTFFVRQW